MVVAAGISQVAVELQFRPVTGIGGRRRSAAQRNNGSGNAEETE